MLLSSFVMVTMGNVTVSMVLLCAVGRVDWWRFSRRESVCIMVCIVLLHKEKIVEYYFHYSKLE